MRCRSGLGSRGARSPRGRRGQGRGRGFWGAVWKWVWLERLELLRRRMRRRDWLLSRRLFCPNRRRILSKPLGIEKGERNEILIIVGFICVGCTDVRKYYGLREYVTFNSLR